MVGTGVDEFVDEEDIVEGVVELVVRVELTEEPILDVDNIKLEDEVETKVDVKLLEGDDWLAAEDEVVLMVLLVLDIREIPAAAPAITIMTIITTTTITLLTALSAREFFK